MRLDHKRKNPAEHGQDRRQAARAAVKAGLICAVLLWTALFPAGCMQKGQAAETETTGIVEVKQAVDSFDYASSKWPADSRLICGSAPYPAAGFLDCKVLSEGESCRVRFGNVRMEEFLGWLSGLSDARWYLSEAGAVKGPRKINISYRENVLALDFTKAQGEGDWPEELPDGLCAGIPYFPYGKFDQLFEKPIDNCRRAYLCIYRQVSGDEALAYENMLLQNGFTYRENSNQRRYFEKGSFFVAPNIKETNNTFSVIIGEYNSAAPVWPDGFDGNLKSALPPAGGSCTVSKQGNAVCIGFTDMHMDDTAAWFGALLKGGWTFYDGGNLENRERGLYLNIAEYAPAENRLAVEIANAKGSAYRVTGFDDGQKDWDYVLTKAKYAAKDAKKGVSAEFGEGAALADWKELVQNYGKNANAFLDACGVAKGESVWTAYNKKESKGNKHYLLKRPGSKAGGTALQRMIGNAAWLQLSGASKNRALAKIKAKQ